MNIPENEESINTGESEDQQEIVLPEANTAKEANSVFNLLESNKEFNLKSYDKAKVVALNKITAKSEELIIAINKSTYFGNIEIKIHKCLKNDDPYLPDNKILLTVIENKIDEDQLIVFQGWMMSSDIAFSTFEHPVYEIFAKDCL